MFTKRGEQFSATAKARVRKGTLLDGELFRRLLDCSQVSDVAHMLMSTYYGKFLPTDAETLHRDKFEFLLISIINSEVQSFFSSAGIDRRAFLKMWLERQDIQLIKSRIWEIYAGKTGSDIETGGYEDLSSLEFSLVDKRKLLSSNRIEDIITSIKNDSLATYLEDAMKRSTGGISPTFMLGYAIDAFHNNRLFDTAKCFSGREQEGLLSLTGTYIDIMNITSIYRGKRYFNMPGEFTLSILNSRYHIDFEKLKTISSLPPERMYEPLAGTRYALLLPTEGKNNEMSDAASITYRMRSIERANALRVFQSGNAGTHFVLAYLILRELEIMDLSAIIEIVRYNYDRSKAEKLIAYPISGGR